MSLGPGTYVTSSVRLDRPLGKGGMGSVWVARHESLDSEVAVKFVSSEAAAEDPSIVARFKREAALSSKIKSPHVVKTFDHGIMDGGVPYIVMELLDGETLGGRLGRVNWLAVHEVSVLVSQVAQVLDEAHRLGVVHRDIKPDNVFLIATGYDLFVKVLDFGIAKQTQVPNVSHVTDTGMIVGTPEYMSPEQLLSTKTADFRCDLWALAVLAYHCLIGRPPFRGETLPSLSIAICHGEFTPPSQLMPELPPDIDGWFARAFDRTPENRFAGALEMADAFRRIVRASLDAVSANTGSRRMSDSLTSGRTPSGNRLSGSEDSGVRKSVPNADADQSGRRFAVSETTPVQTSPTFSGAAANLAPENRVERRRSRLKLLVALVAAGAVALVADFVLRRSSSSDASPARSAAEGAPAPSATSTETEQATAKTAEPTATTTATQAVPTATASQVAAHAPPHFVGGGNKTPPPPAPPPPPKGGGAKDCYYAGPDGNLKIKPDCL
jgi:eukaryotic-like serine/threonine-protein kinase